MCLIIKQPAGTRFDRNFIAGVHIRNDDGIGVMSVENGALTVRKFLPKTLDETLSIYEQFVAEKECVVHFRMKTHGHIDFENCHPYEVMSEAEGYQLWMMHNGILHTGNNNDKTKSDTWHYIRDYLRPMLLKNPEFFMDPAFSELVGNHIGEGNKFVFMDALGNVVTVNEDQGVMHNNAWLSNTYAWDTTGTEHDIWGDFGRKSSLRSTYLGSGYGSLSGYGYGYGYGYGEFDDDVYGDYSARSTVVGEIDPAERYEWVEYMSDLLAELYGHDHTRNITTVALTAYYNAHGFTKSWRLAEDIGAYEFEIDELHEMLLEDVPEAAL